MKTSKENNVWNIKYAILQCFVWSFYCETAAKDSGLLR